MTTRSLTDALAQLAERPYRIAVAGEAARASGAQIVVDGGGLLA